MTRNEQVARIEKMFDLALRRTIEFSLDGKKTVVVPDYILEEDVELIRKSLVFVKEQTA